MIRRIEHASFTSKAILVGSLFACIPFTHAQNTQTPDITKPVEMEALFKQLTAAGGDRDVKRSVVRILKWIYFFKQCLSYDTCKTLLSKKEIINDGDKWPEWNTKNAWPKEIKPHITKLSLLLSKTVKAQEDMLLKRAVVRSIRWIHVLQECLGKDTMDESAQCIAKITPIQDGSKWATMTTFASSPGTIPLSPPELLHEKALESKSDEKIKHATANVIAWIAALNSCITHESDDVASCIKRFENEEKTEAKQEELKAEDVQAIQEGHITSEGVCPEINTVEPPKDLVPTKVELSPYHLPEPLSISELGPLPPALTIPPGYFKTGNELIEFKAKRKGIHLEITMGNTIHASHSDIGRFAFSGHAIGDGVNLILSHSSWGQDVMRVKKINCERCTPKIRCFKAGSGGIRNYVECRDHFTIRQLFQYFPPLEQCISVAFDDETHGVSLEALGKTTCSPEIPKTYWQPFIDQKRGFLLTAKKDTKPVVVAHNTDGNILMLPGFLTLNNEKSSILDLLYYPHEGVIIGNANPSSLWNVGAGPIVAHAGTIHHLTCFEQHNGALKQAACNDLFTISSLSSKDSSKITDFAYGSLEKVQYENGSLLCQQVENEPVVEEPEHVEDALETDQKETIPTDAALLALDCEGITAVYEKKCGKVPEQQETALPTGCVVGMPAELQGKKLVIHLKNLPPTTRLAVKRKTGVSGTVTLRTKRGTIEKAFEDAFDITSSQTGTGIEHRTTGKQAPLGGGS